MPRVIASGNHVQNTAKDRRGKYLTCSHAVEENRLGILKVREIIGYDCVREVPDIAGEYTEDLPVLASRVDTDFILGMGKVNSAVKIHPNIEKSEKAPGSMSC